MSNIVNEYIIGCDFMKFDEFKIDGVEIKINDEYALINGTIKIMLSQISEVIIVEPDWIGVGSFELKFVKTELDFKHIYYFKGKEEFEAVLKMHRMFIKNNGAAEYLHCTVYALLIFINQGSR